MKRGNEIDKQLRDIRRVKAYDEIVQEALAKRDAEELRLKEIKAAAWQIKKDLREAQEKQTEAERRRREDEEERERWGVIKDGNPPKKKDEVVQEVEDCLDVEALKARIVQLEGSETLSKSWVRETLVMNLTQVIADVAEIRAIQALPEEQEHEIPEDERYHGLVVMSMVHEEKVQSAMHRKEQRVQRLRDKIVFRIKAADE